MEVADRKTILALVNALPEGRAKHRYEQMLERTKVGEWKQPRLPACPGGGTVLCSVTVRGFTYCMFQPWECGFALRV